MSRGIRVVYAFPGRSCPPIPELFSARALTEQAVLAEKLGFEAVSLDDHPIPPESWRQDISGHDGIDPFTGLAAVAAATCKVQLFVNAAVVPYRNPFLLAKMCATLDVVSEGRLMLGLVAGYLPAEAAALGVDFATRNEMIDEAIHVMKLAWKGEPVTYKGRNFTACGMTAQPRPIQRPHPPLWIGGNSKASLRRVVEHGTGWAALPNARTVNVSRHTPFLESLDDFKGYVARLQQMAAEVGRTEPIQLMYFGRNATGNTAFLRSLRELQNLGRELGTTFWTAYGGNAANLAAAKDDISRFADEVLAKL